MGLKYHYIIINDGDNNRKKVQNRNWTMTVLNTPPEKFDTIQYTMKKKKKNTIFQRKRKEAGEKKITRKQTHSNTV